MVSISQGPVQAVESLQAVSLLAEDGAKKKETFDRSLNGRRINRPGEPEIVHAHNAGCRSGRIIQIYVVRIIVYAIAVSIEVSDPRRI
jgi:hypothetical protein